MDPAHFLDQQLAQARPDRLLQLMSTVIDTLMSADDDAVCGATNGRLVVRPGQLLQRLPTARPLVEFDTRVGTIDAAIAKLCSGSYFPN
ncbi:hypothetical protein AB1207_22335 [Kineococcus endophyticus]|uniref:Uncharacterized protein n=1 Tax=Kineococcus endophyticus TaxID=1181883 RepID=A0ABV3PDB5_9ACTN